MSIEGILEQAEHKTSKKGNPYYRLLIKEAEGAPLWHTYFGAVPAGSVGARCGFGVRDTQDGHVIDTISVQDPPTGQPPVSSTTPGPAAVIKQIGGHKDMWICMESIFGQAISTHTDASVLQCKEFAVEATRLAMMVNEVFEVYDSRGYAAAKQMLSTARPGHPAAQAQEIADKAAQAHTEPQAAESDSQARQGFEFDDDIPF